MRIVGGNDPLDVIAREISAPFELVRDGPQRRHAIGQDFRRSRLGIVKLLADGGQQLGDVGEIIRRLDIDAAELAHAAPGLDRAGEARGASDVGCRDQARADTDLAEDEPFGGSPGEQNSHLVLEPRQRGTACEIAFDIQPATPIVNRDAKERARLKLMGDDCVADFMNGNAQAVLGRNRRMPGPDFGQ